MQEIELQRHPETGELIPEEWESIPGQDGYYDISNYGRVRSWKRHALQKGKSDNPRIRKPQPDKDGYHRIALWQNNKCDNNVISRLVANAFIPNPENKPEVNHLDGDKSNNFYLNLEWSTSSENTRHAFKNGLMESRKGEDCNFSKLKRDEVISIREMYKTGNYLQSDLGDMFDISPTIISRIVRRKIWKHI